LDRCSSDVRWNDALRRRLGYPVETGIVHAFFDLSNGASRPSEVHSHSFTLSSYSSRSFSELYGKQKDHEMLRRYSKLQDVCFQLYRFRQWNASDELILHAFMLQSKLQLCLKNFIWQRITYEIINDDILSSELIGYIESHYGWSAFVTVLFEQLRQCAFSMHSFVRWGSDKVIDRSEDQNCGLACEILSHLWNNGPSSVTLRMYDAAYTEWKLLANGPVDLRMSYITVGSFLIWLTEVLFIVMHRLHQLMRIHLEFPAVSPLESFLQLSLIPNYKMPRPQRVLIRDSSPR
jgi:hypothetical protein